MPGNILVVDDIPDNLHILTEILSLQGYKSRPVTSGRQALAAAENDPPDLILLDVLMPEQNGYEVCRVFKQHPFLHDIPIIFLSALNEVSDKIKAFQAGGVDYITKPFRSEEVKARVETHLKLRTLQLELEKHNRHLQEMVREKVREIYASQMATIFAMAKLAESRDDETGRHLERVRTLAMLLATRLSESPRTHSEIDSAFIENIFYAGPLHDIGKVGIRDQVLLKPAALTPGEFEEIKAHTLIGARTLEAVRSRYPKNTFLSMGIEIARSHHEKWEGSGYPEGLSKTNIPLSARIMAVADVYDALRSNRPYRPAMSHDQSCEVIFKGSGSHFDPTIVEAFREMHDLFRNISEETTN